MHHHKRCIFLRAEAETATPGGRKLLFPVFVEQLKLLWMDELEKHEAAEIWQSIFFIRHETSSDNVTVFLSDMLDVFRTIDS